MTPAPPVSWSAKQYVTFEAERTRPIRELLAALPNINAREVMDAVQMPDNLDEPSHQLMREVAMAVPWADNIAAANGARTALEPTWWYVDRLPALGCRVDVWRTTYFHALLGPAAIAEWFKGSGLRPFFDPLTAHEKSEYLRRYTAAVAAACPAMEDGRVLLPFPRLFIVAVCAL